MIQSKMVRLGPGKWSDIHITAAWSNTPEKVAWFCIWMRMIADNLECEECRGHAAAYINANPPEQAEDPFVWAWRFHNAVNKRLGKEEMNYETARGLYLEGGIKNCTAGCNGESSENSENKGASGASSSVQTMNLPTNQSIQESTILPNILPQTVHSSPPPPRKISNTLTYRGGKKKK